MRASTIEGVLAAPIVTMSLPVNIFITALVTVGIPLSKASIGALTALPFSCNFLQVFFTPFVTRFLPTKGTAIVTAAIHTGCWAWLAWELPRLFEAGPAETARFLLVWFFIACLFNATLAVVWNGWMHEIVPPRVRGRYFSRRNRSCHLATLVFVFLTGWLVSVGDYSASTFQCIIAGACICRLASLYYFAQMPGTEPAALRASAKPKPLGEQFSIIRRSESFLLFVLFGALWSFGANCFGPFYHVFLFEQVGLSATEVGALATLAALGGVLSLRIWGRLLDNYGNKAVMAVALALWQVMNFFWCIVTAENSYILYALWLLCGALSAGFVLGQFTIVLKLIPPDAKNMAIGFNLAVSSVVAAVSPILGGWILGWAFARGYEPLDVYHAVFIVQPVVGLIGCILLVNIKEPASSPLTTVVGAMRNVRTLSGVMGLSFLTNYLFVKPVRRRR